MWREEPREECIIFGQIEPLDCLPIQNLHINNGSRNKGPFSKSSSSETRHPTHVGIPHRGLPCDAHVLGAVSNAKARANREIEKQRNRGTTARTSSSRGRFVPY